MIREVTSASGHSLHDLILGHAALISDFHGLGPIGEVGVLDETETERPATILVTSEFGYMERLAIV